MRLFILAGMIGSTLSMLVITIDGLLRRRDFAISQAISDLGKRLHGWVLNKDLNPIYRRTPRNRNCRWNEWTTPEAEQHGRKPRKPASRLRLKPAACGGLLLSSDFRRDHTRRADGDVEQREGAVDTRPASPTPWLRSAQWRQGNIQEGVS
jgi:hypothetical protein